MKRYEQVPHTSDIAARIFGRDIRELFVNAAFAMFDMMADLKGLSGRETVEVKADAADTEGLLVAWLNELLYLSYDKGLLLCDFRVISIEDNKLVAEAAGQIPEEGSGRLNLEIKAATYHDLNIKKNNGRYEVTVVFDV